MSDLQIALIVIGVGVVVFVGVRDYATRHNKLISVRRLFGKKP